MKIVKDNQGGYVTGEAGNNLYPNTFQAHNVYVDELMHLLTAEEFKVLMFAVREIMGWRDKRETRRARIALTCFEDGYQSEHGRRLSYGTGLSLNTVKVCLTNLCRFRILIKRDTNNDGTEYELNFNRGDFDILGLYDREQQWKAQASKRIEKATQASKAKRGIVRRTGYVAEGGTSDDSLGGTSDDSLGGTSDDTNETNETNETQREGAQTAPLPPDKEKGIEFPPVQPRENRTSEQIKRDIAAAAGIGAENQRKKRGKRRGADPWQDACDEQRDWAARIGSVILRQDVDAETLARAFPAAMLSNCVWKARDVMADIQAGKFSRAQYDDAFRYLMNGGGQKYEGKEVTPGMVMGDVAARLLVPSGKGSSSGAINPGRILA